MGLFAMCLAFKARRPWHLCATDKARLLIPGRPAQQHPESGLAQDRAGYLAQASTLQPADLALAPHNLIQCTRLPL